MDKDAVLAFAKKNIISLICGFIAVLAVGFTFYPLGGMQDTLQQQADDKAKLSDTLGAFMKERKRPVNSLETTDYGRLDGMPNAATIKLGKDAAQVWKEYGSKTLSELIEMNKAAHPLMQTDELPMFNLDSDSFKFPKLYLAILSVDPTVSGVATKDGKPSPESKLLIDNKDLNLQNDVLHGGKPPTPTDENAAEKDLWNTKYEVRIVEQNGKRVNEPDLLLEYNAEVKDLPLKLKRDMANKYKCYVEPTAFNLYNSIATDPTKAPAPDEVWYCQTQVWVDRDLCDAIAQINATAASVITAPVKRVLSVNNVEFTTMYVRKPAAAGATGQTVPAPVVAGGAGAESAPIVPDYTVSPTGRYCNAMYDVVRFNLCVDVDASKVNEFIETLSRNNFMTVTSESDYVVDTQDAFSKGFLYGNGSVVRLNLSGESLFFRGWTAPGNPTTPGTPQDLMPARIKEQLGLIAPTVGGPGMTGMPQAPQQGPGGARNFSR